MQDEIVIVSTNERIGEVISASLTDTLSGEMSLSFQTKMKRTNAPKRGEGLTFRGQSYKITDVDRSISGGAFLMSISAEQASLSLADEEYDFESFKRSGKASDMLNRILSGTEFEGSVESSIDTYVVFEHESSVNRRALLNELCEMIRGELVYDGFSIHIKAHRGKREWYIITNEYPVSDFHVRDTESGVSYELVTDRLDGLEVGDEVVISLGEPFHILENVRIISLRYNPFYQKQVIVEMGDYQPDIVDEMVDDQEQLKDFVKDEDFFSKAELSIEKYVNSEEGKASLVHTLEGEYISADEESGFVKKINLSADIAAYIDTASGTAQIIQNLSGTFAKEDELGKYVEKTSLDAEIGAYIDTEAGTGKIVNRLSGTYQKQSDMGSYAKKDELGKYVEKTSLDAEIGAYIDTEAGTGKIVNRLSGTYQKQSDMGSYAKKTDIPSLDGYVLKTSLDAEIGAYIDTEAGTGKIVNRLSGTYQKQADMGSYAKKDELGKYVEKTSLDAEIGAYIDTEAGTGKIVNRLSGTYQKQSDMGSYAKKTDIPSLDGYVLKTALSVEIGAYIDTTSGTAKIVNALSGTYQKKSDMSGYVLSSALNASIGSYIDSTTGKAKIETAVSGTYQKKSDMSGYVLSSALNASIGSYIDSTTGKAKIETAVSGTYQKISGMSDYAKASVVSTISQDVSDVEAAITLSSSYTKNTIGTNVYALLQLVSNPNSSSIKLKADKIDFTGFTTFLRASDLGASGSTTIDGGRITTGTISADRIDVDNLKVNTVYGKGTYKSYVALTTKEDDLYIGGEFFSASYSEIYLAAKTKVHFGSVGLYDVCVDVSGTAIYSAHISSKCGTSSYPWREVHMGGDSSYHILVENRTIRPSSSSTSYPMSLGTSSYPWANIYAKNLYTTDGSTQIGNSSGKLGFFGKTPSSRQTVSNSATVETLIIALKNYGLIA